MSGYSVYVLDWTDRGGRQYVGLTAPARGNARSPSPAQRVEGRKRCVGHPGAAQG